MTRLADLSHAEAVAALAEARQRLAALDGLTIKEAMGVLRKSDQTVRRLIDKYPDCAIRVGGVYRIDVEIMLNHMADGDSR